MINQKTITFEQGAQALRASRLRFAPLEITLQEQGVRPGTTATTFSIGDLLVLVNAITETQLLAARELELVEDRPLEEVIVECGMTNQTIVDASIQLSEIVREGGLSEDQAARSFGG